MVDIVPFEPEHAEGFAVLVVDTLREFGFEHDPELDRDLDDPARTYAALWMLRVFWDAALALDSGAPDDLRELWLRAQLEAAENDTLVVEASYRDFDDYWEPFTSGVGPGGAYCLSLNPDRRAALREECRRRLGDPDGAFTLSATAWAGQGSRQTS